VNLSKQQLLQIIKEEIASLTEDRLSDLQDAREREELGITYTGGPRLPTTYAAGSVPGLEEPITVSSEEEAIAAGLIPAPTDAEHAARAEQDAREEEELKARLGSMRQESLTRLQLRQMVMEEIANELEEGRVTDFLRKFVPTGLHTQRTRGGRVTRGGSQGKRALAGSVLGVDASETAAEAEGEMTESLTRLRLRQMVMEELQVNEEEKWIQGAEEDIEKRGTEGVCTGKKFGGPTCRAGTKRYNLAKTFRKMAKKRKKKKKE
jgi:hypothetical protein